MSIVVIDENLQSGGSKQITLENNPLPSNLNSSQPQKDTPILCEDSTIISLSPNLPSFTNHPIQVDLEKIDSVLPQTQECKKKDKRTTFPFGKMPRSGSFSKARGKEKLSSIQVRFSQVAKVYDIPVNLEQNYFAVETKDLKPKTKSQKNDQKNSKDELPEIKHKPFKKNYKKASSEQDTRFIIFSPYVRLKEHFIPQYSSESSDKIKTKERATSQPGMMQNDTSNISASKINNTNITDNDFSFNEQDESGNKSFFNPENKEEKLPKKQNPSLELPQLEMKSKNFKAKTLHVKSPSLNFEISKQSKSTKNNSKSAKKEQPKNNAEDLHDISELPLIYMPRKMNLTRSKERNLSISSQKHNQSLIEPSILNHKNIRSRRNQPYKLLISQISTQPNESINVKGNETSELSINSFENSLKDSLVAKNFQKKRKPSTSEYSDLRSTELSNFIQHDLSEELTTAQESSSLLTQKQTLKQNKLKKITETKDKSVKHIHPFDPERKKLSNRIEETQGFINKAKNDIKEDENHNNELQDEGKEMLNKDSKKENKETPLLPSVENKAINHSNKQAKKTEDIIPTKLTTEQRYEKLINSRIEDQFSELFKLLKNRKSQKSQGKKVQFMTEG